MEKMYQDYKDIAEFRLVYIREAHAADSNWPVALAKEKGINQHNNYEERCTTAKMLMNDRSLTMPMLIDGMNNAANEDYRAYPDRVFLVRSDGRLAVAAERGPWGFGPGLKATEAWLAQYQESGNEPKLSDEVIANADKKTEERTQKRLAALSKNLEKIRGSWAVKAENGDQVLKGVVKFSVNDGEAEGSVTAGEQESSVEDLRFNGRQLSFSVTIHESEMHFHGEYDGTDISGELETADQKFKSSWKKQ